MRRSGPALGVLLAGGILLSLTLLTGTRAFGDDQGGCADEASSVGGQDSSKPLRHVRCAAAPAPTPQLEAVSGDVDCDGVVTAVDALQVLRFIAGLPPEQHPGCLPVDAAAAVARNIADVNCDGDVDSVDALRILRYVASLPELPTEPGCLPIGGAPAPTPTSTPGPPTFTPTPCPTNCPLPTPVPTPPPTTQFIATNNTGVTANDLHLVLAAVPHDVILVPNVISYPLVCGPYGLSHQVTPHPQQITIDWTGGPCIADGESVTLELLEFGCGTPCASVTVECLHWTLDGEPIGAPCPTTTPTPTHTPAPSPCLSCTPTPTPTPVPATTPCAGCTPSLATPTPTFPPFTVFTATNDTGVAANDLHLVLAAPEGVSVLTQVLDDPPDCGTVTSIDNSVLMDGTTITWSGPACIQHGESVVLQFLEVDCGTPCAPVTVDCLHWTVNGTPIGSPCPGLTPTPTPTPCAGCTPTPTPVPTPTPAPRLPIDRLGIDTDPTGNTATSLGTIQNCASLGADATFTIDVVVASIQPQVGMSGGLKGFAFDLVYDPAKLTVTGVDNALFLVSSPGSSLLDLSDPVPDTTGNFTVIAIDVTGTPLENGSGVLSRITLHASPGASGLAHLGLENVGLVDAADNLYWIALTTEADAGIGQNCPTPVVTIPPTSLPGTVTPTPTATATP